MNEVEFFANIARRLGRNSPCDEPPYRTIMGAPDFWRNYQLSSDSLVSKFQESLENLGGHVKVCANVTELRFHLSQILSDLNPKRIGTWGGDTLDAFAIDDELKRYLHISWHAQSLHEFEQVDVGITGCTYAVADTGTLVMTSDAHRGRSVSVLPPVHVALVHERQIVTRLGEVMDELSQTRDDMPSSVHFISGPSRSSDIENDSTIGIHGPAAVYVLVLRN